MLLGWPSSHVGEGRLLFQGLRLEAGLTIARSLLIPILPHPGFPTLAGSGVAPRKGQRSDLRIRNFCALIGIFWQKSHERIAKSGAGHPIKDVAFEFAAIPACNRNIAAIVERFFEGFAQIVLAGKFRNPTL